MTSNFSEVLPPTAEVASLILAAKVAQGTGDVRATVRAFTAAMRAESSSPEARPHALDAMVGATIESIGGNVPRDREALVSALCEAVPLYDKVEAEWPIRNVTIILQIVASALAEALCMSDAFSVMTANIAAEDRRRPLRVGAIEARSHLAILMARAGDASGANEILREAVALGEKYGLPCEVERAALLAGGQGDSG